MNANRIITVSNILTSIRVLLTPVIIAALFMHQWTVAFIVVVLAAASDLFDGLLARMRNEQTHFGAMLDPIADKIFIIGSLGVIVFIQTPLFKLPIWFFCLLLIRECAVVIGTLVVHCYGIKVQVQPTMLGKVSAACQMLFIIWLFSSYFFAWAPAYFNEACIGLITLLSLFSFAQYFCRGIKYLFSR